MLIPILTTLALAELSARDDARQIARHLPIDHAMQWYIRALVVIGVCLVFCVPWLSIGLAGLFSAVFRFRLNRLRGVDWRYIAPWSNFYDRVFYAASIMSWLDYKGLEHERGWYNDQNSIQEDVHRAGTIAYIVEGLVFAGVLALHLI